VTRIGSNCLVMSGSHIAHDAQIGNNVVISSNVLFGGHVVIADDVTVGGGAGLHQFVKIGKGAMIGGMSAVTDDVIPHGAVLGNRASMMGLNKVRLRRGNTPRTELEALQMAYNFIFMGLSKDAIQETKDRAYHLWKLIKRGEPLGKTDLNQAEQKINDILDFILNRKSLRSLTLPLY